MKRYGQTCLQQIIPIYTLFSCMFGRWSERVMTILNWGTNTNQLLHKRERTNRQKYIDIISFTYALSCFTTPMRLIECYELHKEKIFSCLQLLCSTIFFFDRILPCVYTYVFHEADIVLNWFTNYVICHSGFYTMQLSFRSSHIFDSSK